MDKTAICSLEDVSKLYRVKKGFFSGKTSLIRALNRVNLDIKREEILGLVGESGCGKSTLARLVLGLERPTSGRIRFEGVDLSALKGRELRGFRKRAQMVFQDPFSSLNPKKTIFKIISQPLKIHNICPKEQLRNEVRRLLQMAGFSNPGVEDRYPHEFSGGQRQRIGIARALATRPDLVVLDEPTSALDVSIQAQIINLILDLQESNRISCLFISHDLPIVEFVSHRIVVMYRGTICEIMPRRAFMLSGRGENSSPHHPYTKFLMKSIPVPRPQEEPECEKKGTEGQDTKALPASHDKKRAGCLFYSRCPERLGFCGRQEPMPVEVSKGHIINCHLFHLNKKEQSPK